MLNPSSELRDVRGISAVQKDSIQTYMQGAIYAWVKNRSGESFALRDLVGGANFEWDGTPLFCLYEKHVNAGKGQQAAIKAAARDLGWLTKSVLARDKRTFIPDKTGLVSSYRWVGGEP
jgi:hypothetical protein